MLVKLSELTDEQLAKVFENAINEGLISYDEFGRLLRQSDLASLGMDSIKAIVESAITDEVIELDIDVAI